MQITLKNILKNNIRLVLISTCFKVTYHLTEPYNCDFKEQLPSLTSYINYNDKTYLHKYDFKIFIRVSSILRLIFVFIFAILLQLHRIIAILNMQFSTFEKTLANVPSANQDVGTLIVNYASSQDGLHPNGCH